MFIVKVFCEEDHVATFSIDWFRMDYRNMTFSYGIGNEVTEVRCNYMRVDTPTVLSVRTEAGVFDR